MVTIMAIAGLAFMAHATLSERLSVRRRLVELVLATALSLPAFMESPLYRWWVG